MNTLTTLAERSSSSLESTTTLPPRAAGCPFESDRDREWVSLSFILDDWLGRTFAHSDESESRRSTWQAREHAELMAQPHEMTVSAVIAGRIAAFKVVDASLIYYARGLVRAEDDAELSAFLDFYRAEMDEAVIDADARRMTLASSLPLTLEGLSTQDGGTLTPGPQGADLLDRSPRARVKRSRKQTAIAAPRSV